MSISTCKIFWENDFLHYLFFGFIGPLLAVLLIFSLHKFLKIKYWLKSSLIYIFINLTSCTVGREANIGCQIKLFGEVGTSPGDIGIVVVTLPLFLICFFLGMITIFFHKKRKDSLSDSTLKQ